MNAIIRKLFNVSSNSWLELQWVLFGAVFLLCAAWTLQVKEHIRIDIVNNLLPKRVQQWIDLIGHLLFLLPFCALMIYHSGPFFMRSYQSTSSRCRPAACRNGRPRDWSSSASSCCCCRASRK